MANNSPSEQVDEQQVHGARLHQYRDSQKRPLAADVEHALGMQIQHGKLALEELNEGIAECLKSCTQKWDLAPLLTTVVVDAIGESVCDHLVKCAGAKTGLQRFIQAVPNLIRDKIGDLLEEADPHGELDFQAWLSTRISLRDIEQTLSTKLSTAGGLWSCLEAREAAINELAESHMRLAKPLAMRAMRQAFELDDLLNEAFLILRRAAEGFDPHNGNRFSSYAKTALERELKRTSPSRIGLKRQTAAQVKAFEDARHSLSQQQGATASVDGVYDLLACNERTRIQIENVRRILGVRQRSRRDGELHLQDALDAVDSQAANPAEEVGNREEHARLLAALERLSPLEKNVLIGVCKSGKSFRRLAKELHKSPSKLSAVYSKALEKLAQRIDSKWNSYKPR